jgi:regulator of replication initiation timing
MSEKSVFSKRLNWIEELQAENEKLREDNETLRFALSTPQCYAGIVSKTLESEHQRCLAELATLRKRLAAIAKDKPTTCQICNVCGRSFLPREGCLKCKLEALEKRLEGAKLLAITYNASLDAGLFSDARNTWRELSGDYPIRGEAIEILVLPVYEGYFHCPVCKGTFKRLDKPLTCPTFTAGGTTHCGGIPVWVPAEDEVVQ